MILLLVRDGDVVMDIHLPRIRIINMADFNRQWKEFELQKSDDDENTDVVAQTFKVADSIAKEVPLSIVTDRMKKQQLMACVDSDEHNTQHGLGRILVLGSRVAICLHPPPPTNGSVIQENECFLVFAKDNNCHLDENCCDATFLKTVNQICTTRSETSKLNAAVQIANDWATSSNADQYMFGFAW